MTYAIELNGISKAYGDHVVLDNFNLKIEEGAFLAVTGRSGAGKSTLLNIIGLLESADSGTLILSGIENPTLKSSKGRQLLKTRVGYLFQNFGLVEEETVLYNLKISTKFRGFSKTEERDSIARALEKVNLSGYEKKKVFQLSGGEQQRVSVAKLLLKSPDIILADEPTGSLDAGNRDVIMSLLKDLNDSGKTVVVVTHDPVVKASAKESLML